MVPLSIVSPHRDDAAFSMGVTLETFTLHKVSFRLVSCFTVSNFAPYAGTNDVEAITRLRGTEDQRFLEALSLEDQVIDLQRIDAPIRRSENFQQACRRGSFFQEDQAETDSLAGVLRGSSSGAPMILPLGLGAHIDHRIAKAAGMAAAADPAVGFYEEMPYAQWGCDAGILLEVRNTERQLQRKLMPVSVPAKDFRAAKLRLIRPYSSQVSLQEMHLMADYGASGGRGERLWITAELYTVLRAAGVPLRTPPLPNRSEWSLSASVALFRSAAFVRKQLKIDRILARILRGSKTAAVAR
jgi:LmbE family N-acetylglucosaminyl deacetylase